MRVPAPGQLHRSLPCDTANGGSIMTRAYQCGSDDLCFGQHVVENVLFEAFYFFHDAAGFIEKRFTLISFRLAEITLVFMRHIAEFAGLFLQLSYFFDGLCSAMRLSRVRDCSLSDTRTGLPMRRTYNPSSASFSLNRSTAVLLGATTNTRSPSRRTRALMAGIRVVVLPLPEDHVRWPVRLPRGSF